MAKKKFDISTVESVSNEDFLKAVAKAAPDFARLTAKTANEVFTEAGFEALQHIEGGATRFYGIAMLVGLQFVDFITGRNVLDDMGVIERFRMSMGSYSQRNRVKRLHNVSPAWLGADGKGLKNGDSPDQFVVRKPEVIQDYYGLNWNYSNFFSIQDFDLKRGWIMENGIGDIVAQSYNMVKLDRSEEEFGLFFHVLDGALNSVAHPMRDTQILRLGSWTDAGPTDGEINALIVYVKDAAESLGLTPTCDIFNAAGAPNDAGVADHVLLIRPGIKSRMEKMMGYAFNDDKLQFPFDVKVVPDFGGMIPYANNPVEGGDPILLQEVYDGLGVVVGYIDASVTINGPAREVNGQWLVNVTSGGATADTTFPEKADFYEDSNADVLGVIAQRGVIFELIQNEMTVNVAPNFRGMYRNPWFNQPDNGINYNHTRNLIAICKPAATAVEEPAADNGSSD